MTIYAIGDIHGHLHLLRQAHDRVAADRAREGTEAAELIHIGDLVDRGPDSAGVVDCLARLVAEDPRVTVLRGNHDDMLLEFLTNSFDDLSAGGVVRYLHSGIGGRETLASYGVSAWREARVHAAARDAVPADHVAFLDALPFSHAAGDCFFAHAGIRPGVALADQEAHDLIWIRDEFLLDTRDHGALIVHGHTPVDRVEHWGNRLAIDTGAAFGGPVTAVAIEGRAAYVLTEAGRVAVA